MKRYFRSVTTAQLSEEISITTLAEKMEHTHGNPSYRNERKHCCGGTVPGVITAVPVAFLHHFMEEKLSSF